MAPADGHQLQTVPTAPLSVAPRRTAVELHGAEVAFRAAALDRGEHASYADHDLARLQLIGSRISIFVQELVPKIDELDMGRADIMRGAFTRVRRRALDIEAIARGFVDALDDELTGDAINVVMAVVRSELG